MPDQLATVRPAVSADVGRLASVLASAFLDDPVFEWLLPDPLTRESRTRGVFATTLRSGAIRRHGVEVVLLSDRVVGAAIWLPPGHWQPGLLAQLRALPGFARALGKRIGPASALLQSLARAHPSAPHWYLYAIGVEPHSQGRGLAGMLLRSRLRRCDDAGLAAYLEVSNPSGVPLYDRFGSARPGRPRSQAARRS